MLGAADYVGELAETRVRARPRPDPNRHGLPHADRLADRLPRLHPELPAPLADLQPRPGVQDAWCKHSPRLGFTFGRLRPDEESGLIPSIIFSPMLVEDGRRLLISNLPLGDLSRSGGEALLGGDRHALIESEREDDPAKPPPDSYALEYPETASVSAVEMFDLLGEDRRDRLRLAAR